MSDFLLIVGVIFTATFVQSLAGFGVALVAMALLPEFMGVQVASPVVALVALTLSPLLLWRYRAVIDLRPVIPIVLASLPAIPFGIWALRRVDEALAMMILGIVLVGYALYGLLNFKLPELKNRNWAILAGFLGGLLGGAYNTSGPPVVIYADTQRWSPAQFKSNLQTFFLVSDVIIVAAHSLNGNLTQEVWRAYIYAVPAIFLGFIFGTSIDRYLKPDVFRKIVLVILIAMGLRLIVK